MSAADGVCSWVCFLTVPSDCPCCFVRCLQAPSVVEPTSHDGVLPLSPAQDSPPPPNPLSASQHSAVSVSAAQADRPANAEGRTEQAPAELRAAPAECDAPSEFALMPPPPAPRAQQTAWNPARHSDARGPASAPTFDIQPAPSRAIPHRSGQSSTAPAASNDAKFDLDAELAAFDALMAGIRSGYTVSNATLAKDSR